MACPSYATRMLWTAGYRAGPMGRRVMLGPCECYPDPAASAASEPPEPPAAVEKGK